MEAVQAALPLSLERSSLLSSTASAFRVGAKVTKMAPSASALASTATPHAAGVGPSPVAPAPGASRSSPRRRVTVTAAASRGPTTSKGKSGVNNGRMGRMSFQSDGPDSPQPPNGSVLPPAPSTLPPPSFPFPSQQQQQQQQSQQQSQRMVPIDVALKRIRSSRLASNGGNGAAVTSSGLLPGRRGAIQQASVMEAAAAIDPAASAAAGALVSVVDAAAVGNGADFDQNGSNGSARGAGRADAPAMVQLTRASEFDGPQLGREGDEGVRTLPSDETFKWARDNYNVVERTVDVWTFVLALRARLWLIDAKATYLGGFTEEKQRQRRRRLAAWVRESILQLGPTFIKLGQLTSARSDLLPIEFVEELSKLQDKVPAFTADKSIALIERELGQPINVLFREFERTPIAAASLGQVHRAVLHNGELVVVKVQRPALKELFDIDLGNMKLIAEYFQSSESLGGPTRDWVGIYEECSTILYQEIDYINEGRNADRFRRDFRKYPWVRVPQVYWDYTSRKVLTLQYLPGLKTNDVDKLDAAGIDRQVIARRAIEAYLIQILKTGFFHADPHPGNLAVAPGNALIYYDFGMMGEIAGFTKDRLLTLFYAVYEKDSKKVVEALISVGALVPTGDLSSVRRSIQFFLDNLTEPKMGREATISAIGEDLFAIAVDQPFRFPATFTFVLRAFTTLEGVGAGLDPNFSFPNIAAPYAQELLDVRDSQRGQDYMVQQLSKQASEVTAATASMPTRIQRMDDFLQQVENGDVKLRVRVLEAERAARRSGVLQVATLNAIGAATLLNMGVSLVSTGIQGPATACFALSGVFGSLVWFNMRRVQRLDKFEKML